MTAESTRGKVLLVENNEDNIVTLADYLLFKGYAVEVARNGREALDCAAAVRPDAILMDIQMPEMDGLEAIQHLRKMEATATTPIIAVTALVMPGDRERCIAAGANHYLSKPVSLRDILSLLESTIRHR